MKVNQVVTGALIDFAASYARYRGVEGAPLVENFLNAWAADRGLDQDQAITSGWMAYLEGEVVPPRIPSRSGPTT